MTVTTKLVVKDMPATGLVGLADTGIEYTPFIL